MWSDLLCKVVKGVVIKRSTEGAIQDVTDAKVAVFAQGVDTASTETKVRFTLGHLHPFIPKGRLSLSDISTAPSSQVAMTSYCTE